MPAQLTVREICERALRKIGAFPMSEDSADPELMFEAGYWLDMLVGHVSGQRRRTYFFTQPIEISLSADTRSYDIANSATDGTYPNAGLLYPVAAWVTNDSGDKYDVEIISKREFDEFGDPDQSGRPTHCYIDRVIDKTVYIWPVPATDDFTLNITAQRFSNDLTLKKRRDQAMMQPERSMDLTPTWNLWATTALAATLGAGPIRRLPDGEVRSMQQAAQELLNDLDGFEDQEHGDTALQQTVYKDF